MDPITLILGALMFSGMCCTVPRAVADAVATARAAKAGKWDFIDAERQRRATRVPMAERWASAWSARRKARHQQAGGNGEYRPGAKAYAADLYHGFFERRLEVRQAKAAARPPYVHDPDRPTWDERLTARIGEKVARLRAARGQRLPTPEPDDEPEVQPDPVEYPPGTVTFDEHGQRVPLAPAEQPTEKPQEEPMTTQTTNPAAAVATEVNTNEDARRVFTAMKGASARLAQAAELAEHARRELAELANAGADGMAAKAFDRGAANAITNARDAVDLGTVGDWAEKADVIGAEAQSGLAALDKYQDAEAQVAEYQIDPTTLAATSS